MPPEEQTRQQIDAQPAASGWVVQTKDKINLAADRQPPACTRLRQSILQKAFTREL